jgi:ribonuclease HII
MSLSKSKSKINWVSAVIIDDDDIETPNENIVMPTLTNNEIEVDKVDKKEKKTRVKKEKAENVEKVEKVKKAPKEKTEKMVDITCLLKKFYHSEANIIEIGADEAGRGPMFGRVYAGAVVLPKDDSFDHYKMKDSKKFTSKNPKKIQEVADYIKANAIAWAVEYEDERVIDDINILQATQSAMHKAIRSVLRQIKDLDTNNLFLLIDGNYFKQLTVLNKSNNRIENAKFETIEGGDNKFTSIAAASILAKVERDKYIEELCVENPELVEKYGIDSNKGYGSKTHMDGIRKYGITKWHRRTFGLCKEFANI